MAHIKDKKKKKKKTPKKKKNTKYRKRKTVKTCERDPCNTSYHF